jgi:hypothetical protein
MLKFLGIFLIHHCIFRDFFIEWRDYIFNSSSTECSAEVILDVVMS